MTTIAKKRLVLYLSLAAVVIIQFNLGHLSRWRSSVPDGSAPFQSSPAGSVRLDAIPADPVSAPPIPPGRQASAVETLQGPRPAAQLAWPHCSAGDWQRAADFMPGRLPDAVPEYLREYARFHQEEMQKVMRNDALAKQVKFLVYVCVTGHCGGLGDRFKGIIGALYLAVVTRRVFIIQHPEPPLSDFLVPHALDWVSWGTCLDSYMAPGVMLMDAFLPPRWGHPRYTRDDSMEGMSDRLNGNLLVSDASNDSVTTFHIMLNLPAWDSILDAPAARSNMERLAGTPWDPLSGPRFAWAWHLLFRPSVELEEHMSQVRSQLHIPRDGSPWVATHMRVGASARFRDFRRSPLFCTIDEGSKEYAACAANLAGIVSRPPFVRVGGELDPSSVPIFIASDNQEAVERMRAHLVGGGHHDAAVSSTGRKATHVDLHVGANASSEHAEFMHTLAEMLLLSQSTCLVVGAASGYSLVAMLLSQDMDTGARCFSSNAGFSDGVCTLAPFTDPRMLAPWASQEGAGNASPGMVSALKLADLMRHKFVTIRHCSQILSHGGNLCPKPLAVDIVFHAVVTGKHVIFAKFVDMKKEGIQRTFAAKLAVAEPCRVDILFARRGMERETMDIGADVADVYMTITVYVDDRQMQEVLNSRALKAAAELHTIVRILVSQAVSSGHRASLMNGINVTMIG